MGAKRRTRKTDPFLRWQQVAHLARLTVISTRVRNIPTPLNMLIVGPPGDGKTAMLQRLAHLPHVQFLSDFTYMGVVRFLGAVRDGLKSALIVPDMGTLVARKPEVAKQTVATIASMCAEGVYDIAVGKKNRHFDGARASFLSAVTEDDFIRYQQTMEQNAFVSRLFLVNFDLSWSELKAMARRKWHGDMRLLAPLHFPRERTLPLTDINVSPAKFRKIERWWEEMRADIGQRVFGFRTPDQFSALVMSSAYLHRRNTVTYADIRFVERWVMPLVLDQFTYQSGV